MKAGRPKLPTELKRIKGTLNPSREKQNPSADVSLAQTSVILPEGTKIPVPKTLTEKSVRKFFKDEISNLQIMGVLSRVDLKQIETMCITLQKLQDAQKLLLETDIADDNFDIVEKRFERLSNKFDSLASKFYISPAARTQLKLNDLNLIKTSQEIQKNESAISNLLGNRI